MAGLPDIHTAGTLVADPELRYTHSGAPVVNFTLACNERRYNRDTSRWEDGDTTFLRCAAWRQLAETTAETLSKGQRVLITGTLRQRSWETTEGDKRTAMQVDVTDLGPSLLFTSTSRVTREHTTTPAGADPWATTDPNEPPF